MIIRFVTTKEREIFKKYLNQCCDRMHQPCVEIEGLVVLFDKKNTYTSNVTVMTKDYGMAQVGVDLLAAWIEQVYRNCDDIIIDEIVINPKTDPPATGAVVQWDYVNDRPIIREISD